LNFNRDGDGKGDGGRKIFSRVLPELRPPLKVYREENIWGSQHDPPEPYLAREIQAILLVYSVFCAIYPSIQDSARLICHVLAAHNLHGSGSTLTSYAMDYHALSCLYDPNDSLNYSFLVCRACRDHEPDRRLFVLALLSFGAWKA
jgi:hypothetical protein